MFSSGTSATVTASAANVTLITVGKAHYNHLIIVNEGLGAGFFSVDAGTTWGRIPAATVPFSGATANLPSVVEWWGESNSDVLIKRDTTTNMGGVYGVADQLSGT